jgi:topoisomerase-4 subunit B
MDRIRLRRVRHRRLRPPHRWLARVEIGEGDKSSIADAVNALMGSKPEARFRFIQERAPFAKDLDI